MTRAERRRSRQSDSYYDDDELRDGERLRVPMTPADSDMITAVHAAHPPRSYYYGVGYIGLDARRNGPVSSPTVRGERNTAPSESSDPERHDWPSSQAGVSSAPAAPRIAPMPKWSPTCRRLGGGGNKCRA
jgi:hypothetical protein